MQRTLSKIALRLDRIFNWFYSSDYNPIYRSGTIAIAFLFILIVSGIYLTFFYRLSEPYEALSALQSNLWLGQWVRSLHRSASDLFIISVLFHVFRMIIQGKAWGPRTLAWLTGVLLLIFLLISGWTGFILVWDQQGQSVAIALAKILDSLDIFADPIGRSFSGAEPPPASFFFLILFIHIVIPLGMIFGLWVHTSKMARATWLPHKKLLWGMVLVLTSFSFLSPTPLAPKADLLSSLSSYPVNIYYNALLPWIHKNPNLVFYFSLLGFLALALMPWWYKPKKEKRPLPSYNKQEHCQGCTQCVQDCPYEAIHMVPRTAGVGSAEVAEVKPWLCVSCGICSASCAPFTMGPEGRKAGDQLEAARKFLSELKTNGKNLKDQILVIGCGLQGMVLHGLKNFAHSEEGFIVYPVQCTGTIHANVYGYFSFNFKKVIIVNCPPRNCTNKDAADLLEARLSGKIEPTLPREEQRDSILTIPIGDGEENILYQKLLCLRDNKELLPKKPYVTELKALTTSIALLFLVSMGTQIPYGQTASKGILKLSFRLAGQVEKTCRKRSQTELQKLPMHMRTPEICENIPVDYLVSIKLDNQDLYSETLSPQGLRNDRPIYFEREFLLEPKSYNLAVVLEPKNEDLKTKMKSYSITETIQVQSGRNVLVHTASDQSRLIIQGGRP